MSYLLKMFFVVLIDFFVCANILAQIEPQEVSATALMRHLSGGFHDANVDLGALNPGQLYSAKIVVVSPAKNDILVDKTKTSCSCTSFSVSSTIIPAEGSIETTVGFKMPESSENGRYAFSVDLFGLGKHVLRLSASAEIKGNLHINQSHRIVELDEGLNRLQIPVFFGSPIQSRNLIPTKSESMGDAVVTVVSKSGKTFIDILVHSDEVEDTYLSGSVGVVDKISQKKADLSLLLSKSKPFSLSPSFIRFVESPDDKRQVTSNVILQIVDKNLIPDRKLRIACWIANEKVNLEVKKLNSSVYRIKIILSDEEFEAIDPSVENAIRWNFAFKSLKGVATSDLYLRKN